MYADDIPAIFAVLTRVEMALRSSNQVARDFEGNSDIGRWLRPPCNITRLEESS